MNCAAFDCFAATHPTSIVRSLHTIIFVPSVRLSYKNLYLLLRDMQFNWFAVSFTNVCDEWPRPFVKNSLHSFHSITIDTSIPWTKWIPIPIDFIWPIMSNVLRSIMSFRFVDKIKTREPWWWQSHNEFDDQSSQIYFFGILFSS